jgi:hypothetical protein
VAAKAKKEKPPPGPDDLVRTTAGEYASGDGRFTVRQSDSNWYVVDNEQTNEFGQELIHGPFSSLKVAREQLPGARVVRPMIRSQARPKSSRVDKSEPDKSEADTSQAKIGVKPAPPPPKPKPPTWIEKLSPGEQTEVRKVIRLLEREGIRDPEALVRRDRGGLQPAIATALLEKRLAAVIESTPEGERATARRTLNAVRAVFTASDVLPDPLPGWALFETGSGREPTKRRVRPASED